MSNITDKVLNIIKKEQLSPMPKWQFWLRDGSRWISFALLVLLAVIAVGLLMLFWSEGPWMHGGMSGLGLFFGRMPLILLSLIILGGLFALADFRNTGRGYRYSFKSIGFALLGVALITGWLFYYFGLSQNIDSAISRVPFYQNREMYMSQVWQKPNEGLLAGQIINVSADKYFDIVDLAGKKWRVDASKAVWRHNLVPVKTMEVKLIGSVQGDKFVALEVRPWNASGGCGRANGETTCSMSR